MPMHFVLSLRHLADLSIWQPKWFDGAAARAWSAKYCICRHHPLLACRRHMSDTQSFPFQSKMHPKLWDGAFSPEERYSQLDARELVREHLAGEDELALSFR